MSTRHLVDPELLAVMDLYPTIDFLRADLRQLRLQLHEMLVAAQAPRDDTVEVTERYIPGIDGAPKVRVLIYRSARAAAPSPALLHIHGGGFIVGLPEMNDTRNRMLVAETGCVVVSVDYRLAPETPFPGPLEDCYAALGWVHAEAGMLGIDPTRIVVGGESAGGGLAAGLALLARDRGDIPIAFQWLIYPMLDDRTAIETSPNPYTGEFVWTRESNRFGWSALLNREPGSEGISPHAAPSREENLSGLPPAFIAVGGLDLFLDENIDYALRLTRAGVPTEFHLYPGCFHGFDSSPDPRIAAIMRRDCLHALQRAFGAKS